MVKADANRCQVNSKDRSKCPVLSCLCSDELIVWIYASMAIKKKIQHNWHQLAASLSYKIIILWLWTQKECVHLHADLVYQTLEKPKCRASVHTQWYLQRLPGCRCACMGRMPPEDGKDIHKALLICRVLMQRAEAVHTKQRRAQRRWWSTFCESRGKSRLWYEKEFWSHPQYANGKLILLWPLPPEKKLSTHPWMTVHVCHLERCQTLNTLLKPTKAAGRTLQQLQLVYNVWHDYSTWHKHLGSYTVFAMC